VDRYSYRRGANLPVRAGGYLVAVGWAQAGGAVFLGLVGLWLAHSYRRQVRLKLAERQVDSYLRLWTLTASATPERTTPLDRMERQRLYEEMMRWYFDCGDGIFVSSVTRDLFVGVRSNLVCPVDLIRPTVLARQLADMADAEAERRRGCVSIRQASLLRTQLKTDLALHSGFGYYSSLRADDRAFLKSCGLSLWRQPWRRPLWRRAGRAGPNPCVCGTCPS
jgi:hypothetical protein